MNFFLISSRTGFVASVSCHSNGINRATVHRSNNAKMYQTQIRRLQLSQTIATRLQNCTKASEIGQERPNSNSD